MRKALKFVFLWLVLFLAFEVFACKTVQKDDKKEPEKAAVTKSQTEKAGSNETGKVTANSKEASKAKVGSNETGKVTAGSKETGKGKPETLADLLKKDVLAELEKKISPSVKKAILPSVVGFLILAVLLSSKKEKDDIKRKRRQKTPAFDPLY
jgi:uncharacterized membrane protein YfcA